MKRCIVYPLVLLFLGLMSQSAAIKRIIASESSPEKRIKIAKMYKDSTLTLPDSLYATIHTNKGNIKVILYAKDAPKTVQNFVRLSMLGFYDGLSFHRYVPNFVIQGGDPLGTGYGDAGYTIPLEISDRRHVKGALGMARAQDPNSGSCQWYITLKATPFLDGKYTVFGKVIDGMETVLELRKDDKIRKIVVELSKSEEEK